MGNETNILSLLRVFACHVFMMICDGHYYTAKAFRDPGFILAPRVCCHNADGLSEMHNWKTLPSLHEWYELKGRICPQNRPSRHNPLSEKLRNGQKAWGPSELLRYATGRTLAWNVLQMTAAFQINEMKVEESTLGNKLCFCSISQIHRHWQTIWMKQPFLSSAKTEQKCGFVEEIVDL